MSEWKSLVPVESQRLWMRGGQCGPWAREVSIIWCRLEWYKESGMLHFLGGSSIFQAFSVHFIIHSLWDVMTIGIAVLHTTTFV